MEWTLYTLAVGIIVFLGKTWIDYLDKMEGLLDNQRRLRRKIQQNRLIIEDKENQTERTQECVDGLEREKDNLHGQLDAAEVLFAEMVRKEKRRSPEAFLLGFDVKES